MTASFEGLARNGRLGYVSLDLFRRMTIRELAFKAAEAMGSDSDINMLIKSAEKEAASKYALAVEYECDALSCAEHPEARQERGHLRAIGVEL